ncbi:hypothetical protein A5747_13650 [Mycobacterium sp. IS-836]|uniref:hypothetical protein n=1 Tax=Mycobacterium sp. IS-836 TaxID=1834160 RepID=UPI00096E1E93|nr:hypothetical protein [Mycobacterium sp. IS-836]OMC55428.1 hypothetical protein A5747_13650 [Mycobacterium sp. IS-836]
MKLIEAEGIGHVHVLELTRRNLEVLLAKLDDPLSQKTLVAPGGRIAVKAVENEAHYDMREPGTVFMPTAGKYI